MVSVFFLCYVVVIFFSPVVIHSSHSEDVADGTPQEPTQLQNEKQRCSSSQFECSLLQVRHNDSI